MWTHTAEKVFYKTVQDALLETYLPLGSRVWVNYRNISAGQSSSLKYQATIVLKDVEGSDDTIPKEYIDKFKPFEIRVALVSFIHNLIILKIYLIQQVEELDRSWDAFKRVLKQHKHLTHSGLVPVHAVRSDLGPGIC